MVVNFWGSLFASHIVDLVLNKWTSPKYQYLQTKKKKSSAKDSLFSQKTMTGQHNKTKLETTTSPLQPGLKKPIKW